MNYRTVAKLANLDEVVVESLQAMCPEDLRKRISDSLETLKDYFAQRAVRGDKIDTVFNYRLRIFTLMTQGLSQPQKYESYARHLIKTSVHDEAERAELYEQLFDKGAVHSRMITVVR